MTTAATTRRAGPARATTTLSGIALAAILAAGCVPPEAPVVEVAAPPVVAFDGHYQGSIRISGTAGSMSPEDCSTDRRFVVDVVQGRFAYTLPHPQLEATSPELARRAAATYNATISADGRIQGLADRTNTVMTGQVSDSRMTGDIFGLLCYYAFAADRR